MSKITGNELAMPLLIDYKHGVLGTEGGITIRQHFAAMMMASYNSNESVWNKDMLDKAKWACEDADALIAELNKRP